MLDSVKKLILYGVELKNNVEKHFFTAWLFCGITELHIRNVYITTHVANFILAHCNHLSTLKLCTFSNWTTTILCSSKKLKVLVLDISYSTPTLEHPTLDLVSFRGMESIDYLSKTSVILVMQVLKNFSNRTSFHNLKSITFLHFWCKYISLWGDHVSVFEQLTTDCDAASIDIYNGFFNVIDELYIESLTDKHHTTA